MIHPTLKMKDLYLCFDKIEHLKEKLTISSFIGNLLPVVMFSK